MKCAQHRTCQSKWKFEQHMIAQLRQQKQLVSQLMSHFSYSNSANAKPPEAQKLLRYRNANWLKTSVKFCQQASENLRKITGSQGFTHISSTDVKKTFRKWFFVRRRTFHFERNVSRKLCEQLSTSALDWVCRQMAKSSAKRRQNFNLVIFFNIRDI